MIRKLSKNRNEEIATAVLVLLINICLHRWLVKLESMATTAVSIVMKDSPDALNRLRLQLDDRKMQVQRMDVKKKGEGKVKIVISVRVAKNTALSDLLLFLGDNPEILEFTVEV